MFSTHALLASLSKTPELMLAEQEAAALASAIATVSEHYDVSGVIPPETLAWVNLAQTVGFIYGPRIFAVRTRKGMERAQAQAEQSGEWFDPNAAHDAHAPH